MNLQFYLALLIPALISCQERPEKDGKIVGGFEVSLGQFPFVLGIWWKGPKERRPFCGATLITDTWALTAAHCIYDKSPRRIKIVAGDHCSFSKDGEEDYEICSIKVHHGYHGYQGVNDIALIELCDKVKYGPRVQSIALAQPYIDIWRYGNPNATVAGWGAVKESGDGSNILRAVNVPIVALDQCKEAYRAVSEKQICAGVFEDGGKDSCQGDSGGPLWWKDEVSHETYVIGIVSGGIGCARPGYPGIYARVSHYYEWIFNTMSKEM